MPRDNPVQFAVVREDPVIEIELLRDLRPRKALLVASGGFTALTLAALRPDLRLTRLDANAAQLDLVHWKVTALPDEPAGHVSRFRLELLLLLVLSTQLLQRLFVQGRDRPAIRFPLRGRP